MYMDKFITCQYNKLAGALDSQHAYGAVRMIFPRKVLLLCNRTSSFMNCRMCNLGDGKRGFHRIRLYCHLGNWGDPK